mmetsp:Transcript_72468/g.203465  ORF Transcript_72468/g.203465 Transcript_72468/m.203465 type:complete len:380 (-) Transcript_72468:124-1263(-)
MSGGVATLGSLMRRGGSGSSAPATIPDSCPPWPMGNRFGDDSAETRSHATACMLDDSLAESSVGSLVMSPRTPMADGFRREASNSLQGSSCKGDVSMADMIPSGARGSPDGWSPASLEGASRRRESKRRSISEMPPAARMTPPELERQGLGYPWMRPPQMICAMEMQADEVDRAREFCLLPSPELGRGALAAAGDDCRSPPRTPGGASALQRRFVEQFAAAGRATPSSSERSATMRDATSASMWSPIPVLSSPSPAGASAPGGRRFFPPIEGLLQGGGADRSHFPPGMPVCRQLALSGFAPAVLPHGLPAPAGDEQAARGAEAQMPPPPSWVPGSFGSWHSGAGGPPLCGVGAWSVSVPERRHIRDEIGAPAPALWARA